MENMDYWTKHLKMVYLQNNLIEKMESMNRLKELEYINLAVNNISLLEGIRKCESLQKLDLTLNFIDIEDLEESIDNLAELPDMREIYLLGNPCTDWEHWKEYIMARVPTIGRIDGDEVTKSMKMAATQKFDMMAKDLVMASRARIEKKLIDDQSGANENAYSAKFRKDCYLEQLQRTEESDKKGKENSMFKDYNDFNETLKKGPIGIYNKNGDIRQANEGKYEWRFEESQDKTCVIFEIKIPKYLDTGSLDVDLQPNYIRMDIKERITQLKIPEDILVEKSKVQRSTSTGWLQITMPKAQLTQIEAQQLRIKRRLEQRDHDKKLRELEKTQDMAKEKSQQDKIMPK